MITLTAKSQLKNTPNSLGLQITSRQELTWTLGRREGAFTWYRVQSKRVDPKIYVCSITVFKGNTRRIIGLKQANKS